MAGCNEIVFPLTFLSDRVYILSESDHLETNLFEVFPLEEASNRFETEELQDRIKTEIFVFATDVETLKVNKFTSSLSKLEKVFSARIVKTGVGPQLPDPRKHGKVILGGRIKLKQVDGFLWHWKNHQPENLALIEKWKESFQSDLNDTIESHIEEAKKQLKELDQVDFKDQEGEKEYLHFARFVETFYGGIEKFIREMLCQHRDQEFVQSQLENLKAYEEFAKEFWVEMKMEEKKEIDNICLDVLKSFQREVEVDEWGDFLGPDGNFVTFLLELDEKIDDDYFSYLINHNLLRSITNFLHEKITLLRKQLSEERAKAEGLSENLQNKLDHEANMTTLLEQYKRENEELKAELGEKKATYNDQNLKLVELKYQLESVTRQKEGLEKELAFRNKEVQFELDKKERDLVERESQIRDLTSQLDKREREVEELRENTMLATSQMDLQTGGGSTFLAKDKQHQELRDNIWETYKSTGEIYAKMNEAIKQLSTNMQTSASDIFSGAERMEKVKGEGLLQKIFEEQAGQLERVEEQMNQKDVEFEDIRKRLEQLLVETGQKEEEGNKAEQKASEDQEKRELVDKLNSKERVINTLNTTMKKMLKHINDFNKEKSRLKDDLEQYIALGENLEHLKNKCWKNENDFKNYRENFKFLSKSKREILNYLYKKCKKRGFFG